MESIIIVVVLMVVTAGIFLITDEKKKTELGTMFWQTQTRTPHELAKSFAYAGEADRILEMLTINPEIFPKAVEFHTAAAMNAPMLYRNNEIPWRSTEKIIAQLIKRVHEIPHAVTHAFLEMGVEGYLGSMEDDVHRVLVSALNDPMVIADDQLLIRFCITVGYLKVTEAIDILTKLMNNDSRPHVCRAARHALQNMGFFL